MFSDISISKSLNKEYKQSCESKNDHPPIDLNVKLLTTGSWVSFRGFFVFLSSFTRVLNRFSALQPNVQPPTASRFWEYAEALFRFLQWKTQWSNPQLALLCFKGNFYSGSKSTQTKFREKWWQTIDIKRRRISISWLLVRFKWPFYFNIIDRTSLQWRSYQSKLAVIAVSSPK